MKESFHKTEFLREGWRLEPLTLRDAPADFSLPEEGLPVQVPGNVHADLLNAGLIPDPFYGDNEKRVRWVQQSDWCYQREVNLPQSFDAKKPIYLVFQGVDTVANIFWNGEELLHTENMFRSYRVRLPQVHSTGNRLRVELFSPVRFAREQERVHGRLPAAEFAARVYLRKAQYSFGWDWGPSLPTMGLWRPVVLWQPERAWVETIRFHTARLESDRARVMVEVEVQGEWRETDSVQISLVGNKQVVERQVTLKKSGNVQVEMDVLHPCLWWPNGEGEPFLYSLQVQLISHNLNILDRQTRRVGIRTIHLQTRENGQPVFRLMVNGRSIFARGANWIPAHSFLTRVTPETYRELLSRAREAHMNLIRVWGGGVYESDLFYRLCDELGLLVWQDLMFACGVYPTHPEFLQNVREEVRQNVDRLQHHPSLALWCGNNENHWIWYRDQGKAVKEMPDYIIYHRILPEVLRDKDPLRPYWPSSPFGEEDDPNHPGSGNRHQWDIWSFWQDYTGVQRDESLFVTEFGFQAPANHSTLERVIPPVHRFPQSRLFEWHNKQQSGNARLFRFLAEHLPVATEWGAFIYLTQLNQAFALKTCLEHWRCRWPETAGAVIWQLNDCWPVSSWSLIDSELKPKLSYYQVKQTFAPYLVVAVEANGERHWQFRNFARQDFRGRVTYHLLELSSGLLLDEVEEPIRIPANGRLSGHPISEGDDRISVVSLWRDDGKLLSRNWWTALPYKYLRSRDPLLNLMVEKDQLYISAQRLALFVMLEHPALTFVENGFILLPGERRRVASVEKNRVMPELEEVRIWCLNYFLQR